MLCHVRLIYLIFGLISILFGIFQLPKLAENEDFIMQMTKFFSEQKVPASNLTSTPLSHKVLQLAGLVSLWQSRVRQRKALAELDERLLRDVDITPTQVLEESNKPFWRA